MKMDSVLLFVDLAFSFFLKANVSDYVCGFSL